MNALSPDLDEALLENYEERLVSFFEAEEIDHFEAFIVMFCLSLRILENCIDSDNQQLKSLALHWISITRSHLDSIERGRVH